jgi:hypothetical protein
MRLMPIALGLMLLPSMALAKDKHPDSDYQDGVLVSFRTIVTGNDCSSSGTVKGTVNDSGDVDANSNTRSSCSDDSVRLYSIKVGDNMFELEPMVTGKEAAAGIATMGWGALFMKRSVLSNQLPGTRLKVRSDKGKIFVKIGDRESPYSVTSAK